MNYITSSGSYYQGDRAHVSDIECAARPEGFVFTGTVSMTPSVMWRAPTQAELDAELVRESQTRLGDRFTRLLLDVNLRTENRLRALERRPAVAKAEHVSSLIEAWKSLDQ